MFTFELFPKLHMQTGPQNRECVRSVIVRCCDKSQPVYFPDVSYFYNNRQTSSDVPQQ